ncbi:MAG: aminotransferase class V-fold PLP-dependent enzyme [Lentisphaerae bacterium]|jgi:dTDP-4-amino-4,6-dideoxygalactose transaminase|nr:aminotransferase class V-fold PLP-dependent enzyme [Lentisphaerota bacterium]MBT4817714.1 aminotransferase class V-fold PLP-dependent enzyme [Lentisphaerota bacterium]MBT5609075.1 aminotransferase class V-fold PLP-dependent enzyme [Lentisphaerota bacterium]MBT7053830.1 aminotransferase class V-fold PLP-dependent enzyme [Lentisphaerota bacterium]MBT7842473.1 aminotransferase class V-fold PLP-dependent enzyme [Lentisphaerota bacterium]
MKATLAINGGTPVRTEPFPARFWGASVVGDEELALVTEVVRSRCLFRSYGEGTPHMVDDLEREAREFFGVRHALGVTSGSAALFCALAGLGIGPGDEVIVPSLMWLSDFNAPLLHGATPVVADIDRTLCVDPDDLERKITPRAKAVVVVYFMGGVGHIDRIVEIGKKRAVAVVEDCAQSCGATFRGQRIGSLGDVGCYSFQHNKIMTSGEGGMVVTNDPLTFERAARYHDLGGLRPALAAQLEGEPQLEPFAGAQFRMNELTGAVALAQLRKLDSAVLAVTQSHFGRLTRELSEACPGIRFRDTGDHGGDAGIALYIDRQTPDKGAWFGKALAAEGIPVGATTRVCNLLHSEYVQARRQTHPNMPPFGPVGSGDACTYSPACCPNTDAIIGSMVSTMITPRMTDSDIDDIRDAVTKVWRAQEVSR